MCSGEFSGYFHEEEASARFVGRCGDRLGGSRPNQSAHASCQSPRDYRHLLFGLHNNSLRSGGLALDTLDPAHVQEHPETWEKVVRKLRAGMMPPAGNPRPDAAGYEAFIQALERELDRTTSVKLPAPGLHRLNRAEYTNVIRDVLGVEVDATKFLPSDDSTHRQSGRHADGLPSLDRSLSVGGGKDQPPRGGHGHDSHAGGLQSS